MATLMTLYLEILNVCIHLVNLLAEMSLHPYPHVLNSQLFQCFLLHWGTNTHHIVNNIKFNNIKFNSIVNSIKFYIIMNFKNIYYYSRYQGRSGV